MSFRPFTRISVVALSIATLAFAALPSVVHAGPPAKSASSKPAKKPAAAATQYECQKCHMKYSAADAKKDKFVDPMDGGKLTPIKPTAGKAASPKPKKS